MNKNFQISNGERQQIETTIIALNNMINDLELIKDEDGQREDWCKELIEILSHAKMRTVLLGQYGPYYLKRWIKELAK